MINVWGGAARARCGAAKGDQDQRGRPAVPGGHRVGQHEGGQQGLDEQRGKPADDGLQGLPRVIYRPELIEQALPAVLAAAELGQASAEGAQN